MEQVSVAKLDLILRRGLCLLLKNLHIAFSSGASVLSRLVPMAAALVTPQGLQLLQAPTPSKPSYEALRYLMLRLISTGYRPDIPWRDHEYYPKPPRVGTGHKIRETNDIAVHNHNNSILHRVPVALHPLIVDNLCGLDTLNLSASCRKMRIQITPLIQIRHTPVTRADKYSFTSQSYVIRYAKMVEVELAWPLVKSRPARVLCSFCLQAHNREAFSTTSLRQGPYERACKGATGTFRICQHKSLTFSQLQRLVGLNLRTCTGHNNIAVLCSRAGHRMSIPAFQALQEVPPPVVPRRSRTRTFHPQAMNLSYLRPQTILGNFGDLHTRRGVLISNEDWPSVTFGSEHQHEKELWTKRQILETLIGMNEYICPHLRTSSLNLWHKKPVLDLAIHLRYHLGDANEVYSADKEAFSMCGEPDCHTMFGHSLAPIYDGWKFQPSPRIFQIWRRIGQLRDVKEPKWVAQLE